MTDIEDLNCYQVLGVSEDASDAEVRSARLTLVKLWHPDRNDSPAAEVWMKRINHAYDTLSDPERRARYDFELAQQRRTHGGASGYGGRGSADADEKGEGFDWKGLALGVVTVAGAVAMAAAEIYLERLRERNGSRGDDR